MIKFSLKCDQDHQFESWFKSAAAYDALAQAGHLTCALCGSTKVTKGMMAPVSQPASAARTAVRMVKSRTPQYRCYRNLKARWKRR